jgi:hypothetical protein
VYCADQTERRGVHAAYRVLRPTEASAYHRRLCFVNGQVLVENGEVKGRSGAGLYMPCQPALTEKIC